MPSLLFVTFIAIAFLQGTFGAPCSKDMSSCVSKCKAKHLMGSHTSGSFYAPNPSTPVQNSSTDSKPKTPSANLKGNPDSGQPSEPAPTSTTSSVSSSKPASSTPVSSSSSGSVSSSDIEAYLSAHNSVRAKHGAAPLTWNNTLSSVAQAWADGCKFEHSKGQFGENLAAGTGSEYTITSAVDSWTSEVSSYDPNNPQPSHFTQVVWKSSTQVGCAVKDCSGIFAANFGLAHYHVCEYSPAGNVIGEFAQNVQA